MKIKRFYLNLNEYIKSKKVLVIYGPRQVGKTTLLKDFLATTSLKYRLDSGDNINIHHILGSQKFDVIKDYAEGYELIAIDEAQKVPNIGIGLKILVDEVPGIKVIATGSSSFELVPPVALAFTRTPLPLKVNGVVFSQPPSLPVAPCRCSGLGIGGRH